MADPRDLLKSSKKGKSLVKGLTYLDTGIINQIVRDNKIPFRVIPSRFRFYTAKELFNRLFLVSPLYKGVYGFAYGEFGRGFSLGASADILELILGPGSPFHLELEIDGEKKWSTEALILLSRMFEALPNGSITTVGNQWSSQKPFVLQSLSGKKGQFKITLKADFWTGYTSPVALGAADIRFKLIDAAITGSYQRIHSIYFDSNPGWYDHFHAKALDHDLEQIAKVGAKIGLKEKAVEWLRDYIVPLIHFKQKKIKRGSIKTVHVNLLSDLKAEIEKLPKRSKKDRAKKFKQRALNLTNPFSKPGSDEIKGQLQVILQYFKDNNKGFKTIFSDKSLEQIESQLDEYITRIEEAKVLNHETAASGILPPKMGNEFDTSLDAFKHLGLLELKISGPKTVGLEVGFLKFDLGKAQSKTDEDKLNWIDDPAAKLQQTAEDKTIAKLNFFQKAKNFAGGLSPGTAIGGEFTSMEGYYQSWNPNMPGNRPLVFSQLSRVSYSIMQFDLGNSINLSTDDPLYKNDNKEEEEEELSVGKAMADCFIDEEIIDRLTDVIVEKAGKIAKKNRRVEIEKWLETENEVKFGPNKKITSTGNIKALSLGLTISKNDIQYSSISAYWEYPGNISTGKVWLERGTGINFGISIEKRYLIRLAKGALAITQKTQKNEKKINENRVYGEFFRLAAALKIRPKHFKTFLHGIFKLYQQNKKSWNDNEQVPSSLLLETSLSLKERLEVDADVKDGQILSVKGLYEHKAFKEYIQSGDPKNDAFQIETIRVRHRVSDSVNDQFSFKVGINVGVGIRVGFEKFKHAGNEAIKDLLIFLPEAKEFYFEGFPTKDEVNESQNEVNKLPFIKYELCNLDHTVSPTIFFPHSFPGSEF
ncbi:MAG: hypothetical protein KDC24_01345 [Saprospiraceae bacterium]|nr:hypothetical protein [Saprospiraceae bacterium]